MTEDNSCYILAQNLAVFCSYFKNWNEAEFKSNRLICLVIDSQGNTGFRLYTVTTHNSLPDSQWERIERGTERCVMRENKCEVTVNKVVVKEIHAIKKETPTLTGTMRMVPPRQDPTH